MSTHPNKPHIEKIRFEQISFAYEGTDPVFDSIDFDFPTNEIVWVRAGHSGAGRSTLLQIMAGMIVPTKGAYFINDQNICEMSFEEFLPYRLSIGYAFDMGGLLHNRTLFENLMLPLLYHKMMPPRDAEKHVLSLMEDLNILRYKDFRPSAVQGGVRKIACLIRPLLMSPDVLLLDDPSLGLGQDVILKYFDLIQELRKQGHAKHVFVSSFDEKLMSLMDHQEIFIEHGMIHSSMPMREKKVVHL